MTPQEVYVRQRARAIGLNPDLAVSVWQQESGKSLDTSQQGVPLSRGRGAAVGPWQVVPAYHPGFPANGTFEQQTDYALDFLKRAGVRGYYGEGKPPPGFPTTDQYEQQVMARIPGAGPLLASTDDAPAYPPGLGGQMDFMGPNPYQMPQPQPQGLFEQLANHPLFNMGLGVLGANTGHYGEFAPAFGRGTMMGMESMRRSQETQAQQKQAEFMAQFRRAQMEKMQRDEMADAQKAKNVDRWLTNTYGHDPKQLEFARAFPDAAIKLYTGEGLPSDAKMLQFLKENPDYAPAYVEMRRAGATNVSVNTGGSKLMEKSIDMLDTSTQALSGADEKIAAANKLISASERNPIVGPGADVRATGMRIADWLGISGRDDADRLVQTHRTVKSLAELTMAGRQAMKGQGQVSDREQVLAEKALSGDISQMTLPEIIDLARASQKGAADLYARHDRLYKGFESTLERLPSSEQTDLLRVMLPNFQRQMPQFTYRKPTQKAVEVLRANQDAQSIKSFNENFGPGAAERILRGE